MSNKILNIRKGSILECVQVISFREMIKATCQKIGQAITMNESVFQIHLRSIVMVACITSRRISKFSTFSTMLTTQLQKVNIQLYRNLGSWLSVVIRVLTRTMTKIKCRSKRAMSRSSQVSILIRMTKYRRASIM